MACEYQLQAHLGLVITSIHAKLNSTTQPTIQTEWFTILLDYVFQIDELLHTQ